MNDKYNQKDELTAESKNGFSCKVKPILQLNLLPDIKKIEDFCEHTFHKFVNKTKGISYIQNWDFIKDFLAQNYPRRSVSFHLKQNEASLFKFRSFNTTAVLLTFNQQEQPYNIYIPGQSSDVSVYVHQDRPKKCSKCHQYGHTKTNAYEKQFFEIAE